mgnify:FL=1
MDSDASVMEFASESMESRVEEGDPFEGKGRVSHVYINGCPFALFRESERGLKKKQRKGDLGGVGRGQEA